MIFPAIAGIAAGAAASSLFGKGGGGGGDGVQTIPAVLDIEDAPKRVYAETKQTRSPFGPFLPYMLGEGAGRQFQPPNYNPNWLAQMQQLGAGGIGSAPTLGAVLGNVNQMPRPVPPYMTQGPGPIPGMGMPLQAEKQNAAQQNRYFNPYTRPLPIGPDLLRESTIGAEKASKIADAEPPVLWRVSDADEGTVVEVWDDRRKAWLPRYNIDPRGLPTEGYVG